MQKNKVKCQNCDKNIFYSCLLIKLFENKATKYLIFSVFNFSLQILYIELFFWNFIVWWKGVSGDFPPARKKGESEEYFLSPKKERVWGISPQLVSRCTSCFSYEKMVFSVKRGRVSLQKLWLQIRSRAYLYFLIWIIVYFIQNELLCILIYIISILCTLIFFIHHLTINWDILIFN